MHLKSPYWFTDSTKHPLPGHDFNREIVEPGTNETFPDGAIGIRVDGDFWEVAALPLEEFRNTTIEKLVEMLWPDITDATFEPDSTCNT